MSVITNQDVLDAIRGLYQSSANRVSDAEAAAKLQSILDKLGDLESAIGDLETAIGTVEVELQAIKSTDGIKKIVETVPVSLTGSKAQQRVETIVFNATALVDTTPINSAQITNFNDYNVRTLMVRNTHDVPVEIVILSDMRGHLDRLSYGQINTEQKVTINGNGGFSPVLITGDHIKALNYIFGYGVFLSIKATTTPTSGSITVTLIMEAR